MTLSFSVSQFLITIKIIGRQPVHCTCMHSEYARGGGDNFRWFAIYFLSHQNKTKKKAKNAFAESLHAGPNNND